MVIQPLEKLHWSLRAILICFSCIGMTCPAPQTTFPRCGSSAGAETNESKVPENHFYERSSIGTVLHFKDSARAISSLNFLNLKAFDLPAGLRQPNWPLVLSTVSTSEWGEILNVKNRSSIRAEVYICPAPVFSNSSSKHKQELFLDSHWIFISVKRLKGCSTQFKHHCFGLKSTKAECL